MRIFKPTESEEELVTFHSNRTNGNSAMRCSKEEAIPNTFAKLKLLPIVSLVFIALASKFGNSLAEEDRYEHSVQLQEYKVSLASRTWGIRASNTIGGMEMILNNRLGDPLYFTEIDGGWAFQLEPGEYHVAHCASGNEVLSYTVKDSAENYYQLSLRCGDVVVITEGF